MSHFVEECRREWRRLRVPEPVADEMAAELAADLEEAQAEGVSAESVLGSGAFDPRSFAASWAAERGVGHPSQPSEKVAKRVLVPAMVALLVAVAISGAVLVIVASPSRPRNVVPPPPPSASSRTVLATPEVFVLTVDTNGSGVDTRAIGLVLLIAGLGGTVPLTLLWSLRLRREQVRRLTA